MVSGGEVLISVTTKDPAVVYAVLYSGKFGNHCTSAPFPHRLPLKLEIGKLGIQSASNYSRRTPRSTTPRSSNRDQGSLGLACVRLAPALSVGKPTAMSDRVRSLCLLRSVPARLRTVKRHLVL